MRRRKHLDASGSAPLPDEVPPTKSHARLADANGQKSPVIEPALTMENDCAIRNESRRTGERERSAGLWPPPDFSVGTGSRKSPRWLAATIRRWLDEQARKEVAK
jgi:hypothetical protein